MKTLSMVLLLAGLLAGSAYAQNLGDLPPVVVKTFPESGAKDVAPGVVEIRVTFSKAMKDQSWSWSSAWKDSTPLSDGPPKYEVDQKTCVLKVKLDPNKTYGFWLNSEKFHGFQDQSGKAAVPYLLVFKTKEQ